VCASLALVAVVAWTGPTASLEPLRFALTPSQTVYLPGDTLTLLATLVNGEAATRADLFAGVILPDGRVRMVTPALALGPPQAPDPRTLVPVVADLLVPAGLVFPDPGEFTLDTNGDGIPDGAGLSASLVGWDPGAYHVFAAVVEPGSATTGDPRLRAPPVIASF